MKKIFIVPFLFLALVSCNSNKNQQDETKIVETISEEKPFTVQITRERSYFQANKIQNRLQKMGIDAYLVVTEDSVEREWYNIMSGAFADSISCSEYIKKLDSVYRLKKCIIVNTKAFTDSFKVITAANKKDLKIEEHKRIEANKPKIPNDVYDVIEKFPDNNAFYLKKISILNLAEPKTLSEISTSVEMDLPRGITLWKISKYCNSFSEAQYSDNLFDDKVTISIMKIKANYEINPDMEFENFNVEKPTTNFNSYALAFDFSKEILNSGTYENENMKVTKLTAFKPMYGYKVSLTTKKGVNRLYFVLVDESCEYLIIAQSVEKTEQEMEEILSEVGKSHGLNNYDEFYNTFYILPDKPEEDDIFLGYSIDKLGWSYAKSKGYSKWSVAMVGHWAVNGYFWNKKKGLWTIGLFDLLNPSKQNYIYGNLYTNAVSKSTIKANVYGVNGHFVEINLLWYKDLELNFGIERYVFAINSKNMTKEDLMKRAEKMQFIKGGYNKDSSIPYKETEL